MTNMRAYCLAFSLLITPFLFSEDVSKDETSIEGYTINYNTVSIVEYIRFTSKICNTNFIFNEADLNFTVTVVSDAPITPHNVMSTLIQVLRIHGLSLLEQENNLVIHRATDVMQVATLVTETGQEKNSAIVTRIFRIKNAKPESVAAVIRPMISTSSLLEISAETRQLILTDITSNVDKVAMLIEILDSPHNQLDIRTYVTQNNSPSQIVEICNKIMTPIAQGSPFVLVPQTSGSVIFIVSTTELLDKAMNILKTIDIAPSGKFAEKKLIGDNVFVYQAVNQQSSEILIGLMSIAKNLEKTGIKEESDLVHTITTAHAVKDSNSIMFVGSDDSLTKVKEFLSSLDLPGKNSFFIYRPEQRSAKEIDVALRDMIGSLKETKGADEWLIQLVTNSKINQATNSIIFTGNESDFAKLKGILALLDSGGKKALAIKQGFFIYKIQQATFNELQASLNTFAKNLNKSNVNDEGIVKTIEDMKYIPETNSILFSGPDPALTRLQELVPTFDSGNTPAMNQFFIYKPKVQTGEALVKSLQEIEQNLKTDSLADPALLHTLSSAKYIKSTNSILFTGDAASIKRLEDMLGSVDVPITDQAPSFFMYPLQYASQEKATQYLDQIANNLTKKGDTNSQDLIEAIRSKKWVEDSHSFMFYATKSTSAQIQELLKNLDIPEAKETQSSYFIYKLQSTTGDVIEEDLNLLSKTFKA